jgi:predicted Zn-dependent protease with MMP-like domain
VSQSNQETWEQISAAARQTIDALIARLPEELRPEALRVGCELQKRKRDEEGTLGDYVRSAPLITLYLDAIRQNCSEESLDFCAEVEKTYLHEFGHHLGLDEDHVEKLGL